MGGVHAQPKNRSTETGLGTPYPDDISIDIYRPGLRLNQDPNRRICSVLERVLGEDVSSRTIQMREGNRMRKTWLCLSAASALWMASGVQAKESSGSVPGCDDKTPKQCVDLALDAMGGRDRLQQVKSVRLHTIGHTVLAEQSYRQEPFITSYERSTTNLKPGVNLMLECIDRACLHVKLSMDNCRGQFF
jgi:hypothetical protein